MLTMETMMDDYEQAEQDRIGRFNGIRNGLIITAAAAAAVALIVTPNPVSSSLKNISQKIAEPFTQTVTCTETPEAKSCELSSPVSRRIKNIITPGI